jgi:enediyne biosynthesis protein E4
MKTYGHLQPTRRNFFQALAGGLWLACRPSWAAQASAGSAIQFENVAPRCGLDFVLRNDASGRKYQVETVLGGLGVIDFDHDGWPDLYCVNGASLPSLQKNGPRFHNRLYHNNRNGTFTDVTEKAGVQGRGYEMGVAVADYNNDGLEDLYVVGVHGNTLYRNNGDGTFTDVTKAAGLDISNRNLWSVAAAWMDYDHDGHLDLVVSNYCDWSAGTDPICGGLNGASRTYCHPDMYRAEPVLVYHNNGDGTFTDVSRELGLEKVFGKGMGIALADFDGNGFVDAFIANDNDRNLLLQNFGRKMKEVGIEAGVAFNGDGRQISGMGADFGDVDGDGLPDIVMTGLRGETYELFRNRGDGTFEDASATSGLLPLSRAWNGWGCGLMDLDNDGWLDLFVACGGLDINEPQQNRVFRNQSGRWTDVSTAAGTDSVSRLHRGVAFADFDNDGRMDAAVTAINEPMELWMNRSATRNWLQVKLAGTRSNRSAIGARVICRAGNRTQVRTVSSSVGYASSSDLRVHFGLGDERAAFLEIHWPSGIIQKMENVSANGRIEITEPPPERDSASNRHAGVG